MRFLAFGAGLAMAVACGGWNAPPADAGSAAASSTIANGRWGGEHVVFEASESGAAIQFDCAHGAIRAPLAAGADGRFDLAGDFVKEHGGPIRVGEVEEHRTARYSGRVRGKTMTLSVEVAEDRETLGPFTLELGSAGRIVRCR